ncbi:hypothetical protein Tco_1117606 [Tanacetum coccineum]
MLESLGLVPQSSNTKFVCSKEDDGEVMFIEIIRDDDEPQNEDPNKGEGATTEEPVVEYFDTFPTRNELTYHSNVPNNSPEQEAATVHSILRRLDSPTSQATQLPELELTLTPVTGRELSQEINNYGIPTLVSQAPGPSRKRSRSPSTPSYPDTTTFSNGKPAPETPKLNPEDVTARLEDMEVEIDTLHADVEDKELLISELQDSLAVAENEISILQIRAEDAENRRAEDHEQIQKILARLGL